MPYINEAIYTLFEGIGTVEGIDKAMKLGTNVPMGTFTLKFRPVNFGRLHRIGHLSRDYESITLRSWRY